MKFFLLALTVLMAVTAQAQTNDKCKPLDELIGKISNKKRYNFSSVNKIYNLSRATKCDDGTYAEGMSNIVVQALVLDFVRTVKVAGKNQSATDFVVGHIDVKNNSADLMKVADNSIKICPSDKKDLCKRIESEAKKGIKEVQ